MGPLNEPELEGMDQAVLATIVTILLVRAGGQVSLSNAEWEVATSDNAGSLWIHRAGPDEPIRVVLMRKTHEA